MSKGFQFLLVLIILFFAWPVFILIGLVVLFFDGGWPVIFKQKRVGRGGKSFVIYKFRTMYQGAEKDRKKLLSLNEADGPVFKIKNDPRFTKIGKTLSRTGLDELPQLFNILKGEMAFIGPRPLPSEEEGKITKQYRLTRRQVLPGIISPWIFIGYHDVSFDKWMKSDMEYVKNKSIVGDIGYLFKSVNLFAGLLKGCFKN